MSWDLKISQYGDLLFAPNRDWTTVSGSNLLAQRIFLRLKIARGAWIFDDTDDLGSQLDLALQMQQPEAMSAIPALVAEALSPIDDEIQVNDIQIVPSETDARAVNLVISATPIVPPEVAGTPVFELPSLQVVLPITRIIE